MTRHALILPILAVVLLTGAASPRQDAPAVAVSPEARAVSQAVTAAELAAWGRERRDPGALRIAARMLDELPFRTSSDGDPGVAPVLSADRLRAEADMLESQSLDEVVVSGSRIQRESAVRPAPIPIPPTPKEDRVSPVPPPPAPPPAPPPPPPPPPRPAPPSAAPAVGVQSSPFGMGPVSTVKQLASRQTWGFEVDARRAEVLRIAAIGDGDTNIDLIVKDARGRTLCTDSFGDHYPVCTLSPAEAGRMRIDVVNRGAIVTRVQVLTN